MPISIYTVVIN